MSTDPKVHRDRRTRLSVVRRRRDGYRLPAGVRRAGIHLHDRPLGSGEHSNRYQSCPCSGNRRHQHSRRSQCLRSCGCQPQNRRGRRDTPGNSTLRPGVCLSPPSESRSTRDSRCESRLPANERWVLRPPHGSGRCPQGYACTAASESKSRSRVSVLSSSSIVVRRRTSGSRASSSQRSSESTCLP